MTTLREAAQQALEALDRVQPQIRGAIPQQDVENAITALRAALAEPEELRENERLREAVAAEREACAEVAESYEPTCDTCPSGVANAIRARGET